MPEATLRGPRVGSASEIWWRYATGGDGCRRGRERAYSLLRLCRAETLTLTEGPMVVLAGCDLIDGTLVIDIKPFAPYDCPVCIGRWLSGRELAEGGPE